MVEANPDELSAEDRAISRVGYVGKVETLALLLLGGVKPENLKIWYDVCEEDLAKAREKIRKLEEGG